MVPRLHIKRIRAEPAEGIRVEEVKQELPRGLQLLARARLQVALAPEALYCLRADLRGRGVVPREGAEHADCERNTGGPYVDGFGVVARRGTDLGSQVAERAAVGVGDGVARGVAKIGDGHVKVGSNE